MADLADPLDLVLAARKRITAELDELEAAAREQRLPLDLARYVAGIDADLRWARQVGERRASKGGSA